MITEGWYADGADLTGALHALRVLVGTTDISVMSCCS